MELLEELEYMDEDTFNQISEDPFQKFVKERNGTTIIEPIKKEEPMVQEKTKKTDKIKCNESELKPSADFKAVIFIEFAVRVSQIFFFEPHLYLKKQG